MTRSARPARMDKPLRCRPLEGRRDQRSPLRRCFKPRPPLSAGCAGFASGCRLSGSELRRPRMFRRLLQAAVRPLVRMPTNRHAATGTCEIGRARHKRVGETMQEFFASIADFSRARVSKWLGERCVSAAAKRCATRRTIATAAPSAADREDRRIAKRAGEVAVDGPPKPNPRSKNAAYAPSAAPRLAGGTRLTASTPNDGKTSA